MYEHFREEERPFIDHIQTIREQAARYHQEKLTGFLDPRMQEVAKSVIGQDEEIDLQFFGGADGCERKRASIRPAYLKNEPIDWGISLFKAVYAKKFVTLTHRDVLGALMNTGMKRETFGDISVTDNAFYVACTKETSAYIAIALKQVGKATVSLEETDTLELPDEIWEEKPVTVSSLRLDALLSALYGLSRAKAADLIGKGLVKVNWKVIEHPSFRVAIGDYLSVRGAGRAKVLKQEGVTKKDKHRLVLGKKS